MTNVKKQKVLFLLSGEENKIKEALILRLEKLGYVKRDAVYTDLSYDKSTHDVLRKSDHVANAVIKVTDFINPQAKISQIRSKLKDIFTSIVDLELGPSSSILLVSNDELRSNIDFGITLSDRTISEEEKTRLLVNRRKQKSN